MTIRVQKIHGNFAEAEVLRRPVQASAPPVNPWVGRLQSVGRADRISGDEEEKQPCASCRESRTKKEIEDHDGFCIQCWLREVQKEVEQEKRRSGTYGADRAGTW